MDLEEKFGGINYFLGREYKEVVNLTMSLPRSQDGISNSPYCLQYNSYDVILGNLVLDQ